MAPASAIRSALSHPAQRVFFALRPDARVRADLARAAQHLHRAWQGRLTRADDIHLTLAFLGDVDAQSLARLLCPPPEVFTAAFVLTLNEWGCWKHNGIGWAAPSCVPEPLSALAANLERWLRSAGFELEPRAYAPHVTLVRKARCAQLPEAMAPIDWPVGELTLMRSRQAPQGARYEILQAWRLR